MNRGWIDKSEGRVPTYNEVTNGDTDEKDGPEAENGLYNEDDFDELAEQFETSYNFRFEEP